MLRAHCLQHVPFEGPAAIAAWLDGRDARLTTTELFDAATTPAFPDLDEIDFLIIMGGPMSAYDDAHYAWLGPEKAYIRAAIDSGKAVIGICLGAQLMASTLGADVYPGPDKEIGWHPLFSRNSDPAAFQFPDQFVALHWHGDTFDLPTGAIHLASSEAIPNQAFQVGERAIGLQFHIEATPASVHAITHYCRDEIQPATWVQSVTVIHDGIPRCREANEILFDLLDYLCR